MKYKGKAIFVCGSDRYAGTYEHVSETVIKFSNGKWPDDIFTLRKNGRFVWKEKHWSKPFYLELDCNEDTQLDRNF